MNILEKIKENVEEFNIKITYDTCYKISINNIKEYSGDSIDSIMSIIETDVRNSPTRINRITYINMLDNTFDTDDLKYFPSYNDFYKNKIKIMYFAESRDIFINKIIIAQKYIYDLDDEIDYSYYAYFYRISYELIDDVLKKVIYGLTKVDLLTN